MESLIVQFTTGKYLPKDADLDGCVLFLETSEEMPDAWAVAYLLIGMGERGWFDKFNAVMVGRPKAWFLTNKRTKDEKIAFTKEQWDIVLKTIRSYNQEIPVVQNLNIGHTDPQIVLPNGNKARLQSKEKKIFLTY